MLVHNAGYSFSAWSTGSVGIDLFFCISGFVMVYAHATDFQELGAGSSFIRRRAIRIVPLYWLATTATLGLLVAMPGMFSSITLNWSNVFCSGAWVAATVSREEQAEVARNAGADLVINRHSENIAARVKEATRDSGVERIVDVDLANNVDTDIACLAPSGVVTAYATDDPQAKLTMPFLRSMFGGYAVRFVFSTQFRIVRFKKPWTMYQLARHRVPINRKLD